MNNGLSQEKFMQFYGEVSFKARLLEEELQKLAIENASLKKEIEGLKPKKDKGKKKGE